jgi:RNA polymerase sigma-70 factor, ECF subfamily
LPGRTGELISGEKAGQPGMESFLKSIERSAYRMAFLASRNREDALDLVQDAFCRFVDTYAHRPREEWKPLFYTILHNAIRDWGRRRTVRRCLLWFGFGTTREEGNELEALEDYHPGPEHTAQVNQASAALQRALTRLPLRQRQAFLLRGWQELSVADTAGIMGCSEGSVKTHYSRAVQTLRELLGDHWP